jgi:hypothetical protein
MMIRLPHGVCAPPIFPNGIPHRVLVWRAVELLRSPPMAQSSSDRLRSSNFGLGLRLKLLGIAVSLFLVVVSKSVSADPITLTYRITLNERCAAGMCASISRTLPLTIRFDSSVTGRFDDPIGMEFTRIYGLPTFSAVPLEPPAAPTLPIVDTTRGRPILKTALDRRLVAYGAVPPSADHRSRRRPERHSPFLAA